MTSKTELKTKQASKPKTVKVAAAKGKTLFYATTLADALMGKHGPLIQRFYVNACSYHMAQKTVFPRPRLVGHPLLKQEEVGPWIAKHEFTSIPAGSKDGQRLFDEMMVETVQNRDAPKAETPKAEKPAKAPKAEKVREEIPANQDDIPLLQPTMPAPTPV